MSNTQLLPKVPDNQVMKRLALTLFFATYYFFMPFVMVNCSSQDQPYALDVDATPSESDGTYTLEQCQTMEFLVDDCIDILNEEEDRITAEAATVSAALLKLDDFEDCQSEEAISPAALKGLLRFVEDGTGDSAAQGEVTAPTIDCDLVISEIISGYQLCSGLTPQKKYDGCDAIEEGMQDALDKCDSDDASVSEDFCSTLTV